MEGLVEFKTDDSIVIAVEAVEEPYGSQLASRTDGTVQATRTFEGTLVGVRAAAESALRVFREGTLKPDGVTADPRIRPESQLSLIQPGIQSKRPQSRLFPSMKEARAGNASYEALIERARLVFTEGFK
jgi:hypothetical protein